MFDLTIKVKVKKERIFFFGSWKSEVESQNSEVGSSVHMHGGG